MSPWKKTFYSAWVGQIISITGFSLVLPFLPLYIRELGVTDEAQAMVWTGVFQASASLTLAIMSPVWGALADRYGRKMMMLRANFSAAVILVLMGAAPNVVVFVILRMVQGALTGTVTAAQTLVASYTPPHRQGLALGAMVAALHSGYFAGALLGGVFAKAVGYREAFYASSVLLLISGCFALLTHERFERPAHLAPLGGFRLRLPRLGVAGPIMLPLMAVAFARHCDLPMVTFVVEEIARATGIEDIESWNGLAFGVFSVGAFVAGVTLGHATDRLKPTTFAALCASGAMVMLLPQALATTLPVFVVSRGVMALFAGGLDIVFYTWLSRVTPPEGRGSVFGWAVTAKALGWFSAPLIGSTLGVAWGVRTPIFAKIGVFACIIPLVYLVARQVRRLAAEGRTQESPPATE